MARNLKEYVVQKIIEYLEKPVYTAPVVYPAECGCCDEVCYTTFDDDLEMLREADPSPWNRCDCCGVWMCPPCAKKRGLWEDSTEYCRECTISPVKQS